MGIERNAAALLAKVRGDGVSFERTLMLGRQNVFLDPGDYRRLLGRLGGTARAMPPAVPPAVPPTYAEDLFTALGASAVDSVDASTYEHATLVHDFNTPIPTAWHQQYDIVFDGGTLEHVFNFPTAVRNAMEALKAGGRFIGVSPLNSWSGHGFYQFSPELFWRTFSPDNGFSVVEMYVAGGDGLCYSVIDPAVVRERVELCTQEPVLLMVHARRDRLVPLFAAPPQQSDYTVFWEAKPAAAPPPEVAWKTLPGIRRLLQIRRHRRFLRQRSLKNRRFYTPVDLSF